MKQLKATMECARTKLIYNLLFVLFCFANCDNLSVKISAKEHVNLVSDKFLSFTVDPKFLFAKKNGIVGKECLCMASALSPAYIRIAGPSTSHIAFKNASLVINTTRSIDTKNNEVSTAILNDRITIDTEQWKLFAEWARVNNFELVFGLNSGERMEAGIWDPNTAMDILTVADKAKVKNIVWQFGYECTNRTIEEYMDDLETLRVMVNTFPFGKTGSWKVIAGDVSDCLSGESKTSFTDYVLVSNEMLDAVFLNGNSSSYELERLEEADRLSLLRLLSNSATPLWLTESWSEGSQLERAVDWMNGLGMSARNGFSVHFREIQGDEIYEPTLSFYMSLLFKNLVGNRVLDVEFQDDISTIEKASLFAHCTTLKHQPIPGAITLFGSNMDDQVTRFSVKLSKREEGGDIMQFILSEDRSGNIIVNGHPVIFEGDIKPVVKRVRPYRTLLITLPPKSFGFWVLANTKIEACLKTDEDINSQIFEEAATIDDIRDKMIFGHKEFQTRQKREAPNRNNIILHKMVKDNEIFKNKFRTLSDSSEVKEDVFNELEKLAQNFGDLQSLAVTLQQLLSFNKFVEKIANETEEGFNSKYKEDLEIKHVHKRQALSGKLKTVISNLSSLKNPLKLSKTDENISNFSKLKANSKELNTSKEKKAIHFKQTIPKLAHITNDSKQTSIYAKDAKEERRSQPKSIFEDAKARLLELRTHLRDNKGGQEHSKDGATIVKRSLSSWNEVEKSRRARHFLKQQANPIEIHEDDNTGWPFFYPVLKPPVYERKRRSVDFKDSVNKIITNLREPLDKQDKETAKKTTLKSIFNKIGNHLPVIEMSEGSDEENVDKTFVAEDDIEKVLKKKNNEIPIRKYEPEYDDNEDDEEVIEDQVILKTKLSDDDASINLSEKSNHHGVLKLAFENFASLLKDVKSQLSRFWALMP